MRAVTFDSKIEQAAIIMLIMCLIGSVLVTAFCFSQLLRKRTQYSAWLFASAAFLLYTQTCGVLRCFTDEGSLPLIVTNFSLPMSLCIVAYVFTEAEFYLMTVATVDAGIVRRRIGLGITIAYALCWTLRVLNDYKLFSPGPPLLYVDMALVSLFLVVTNVGDLLVQARMMGKIQRLFKGDDAGRKRYVFKTKVLLSLLAVYLSGSLVIFGTSSAIAFSSRRTYMAMYVISISLPTLHLALCIVIMENGRACLSEAREPRQSVTFPIIKASKSMSLSLGTTPAETIIPLIIGPSAPFPTAEW